MSFPFDLHSAAVSDSHLSCRCSQGHGTARPSRGYLLAFGFFRLPRGVPRSCNQLHTNLTCRWPVWNQTSFARARKSVVAAHYKIDSVGLEVRIFSATMRTFTKDTALSEHGRGAAWHVWINARHGRGTAWARHAMCESALMITQAVPGDRAV